MTDGEQMSLLNNIIAFVILTFNTFHYSSNIKGSDISSGETLVPYMQPFTPRGVGYQRMVFVLYRQTRELSSDEMQHLRLADEKLVYW